MRDQILRFIFSKGFVRRRNLWYVVYVMPFGLFLTYYETEKLEKIAQLALRRRFTYSQYNAEEKVCSKEEFQIIDHKIKLNNPK